MCEHCDRIWNDFYYDDVSEVGIGLVLVIPGQPTSSNYPAILVSTTADYEEYVDCIPISFCPFCGRNLWKKDA